MLTALNGHLADDIHCFVFFLSPCQSALVGREKNVYRGPNPLSAVLEVTTCDTDNVMVLLISHGDQNILRLFINL